MLFPGFDSRVKKSHLAARDGTKSPICFRISKGHSVVATLLLYNRPETVTVLRQYWRLVGLDFKASITRVRDLLNVDY